MCLHAYTILEEAPVQLRYFYSLVVQEPTGAHSKRWLTAEGLATAIWSACSYQTVSCVRTGWNTITPHPQDTKISTSLRGESTDRYLAASLHRRHLLSSLSTSLYIQQRQSPSKVIWVTALSFTLSNANNESPCQPSLTSVLPASRNPLLPFIRATILSFWLTNKISLIPRALLVLLTSPSQSRSLMTALFTARRTCFKSLRTNIFGTRTFSAYPVAKDIPT